MTFDFLLIRFYNVQVSYESAQIKKIYLNYAQINAHEEIK